MAWAVLGISFLVAPQGHAEIYMGIGPFSTLRTINELYPNATQEWLNPAWAKKEDKLLKLSGSGITGSIIIKFHDPRDSYSELAQEASGDSTALIPADTLQAWADSPAEEALQVSWVRWLPDASVPLARLTAKYGVGSKVQYRDDDFSPYVAWNSRGIVAYLIEGNLTRVGMVDFNFTKAEWVRAYKERFPRPAAKPRSRQGR